MSNLIPTAGTCTINSAGVVSGSGLSLARGQAWATAFVAPALAAINSSPMSGAEKTAAKAKITDAFTANTKPWIEADSLAILTHISNNLDLRAKITGDDGALQRLPASLVDSEPTRGPSTNKYIAVEFTP